MSIHLLYSSHGTVDQGNIVDAPGYLCGLIKVCSGFPDCNANLDTPQQEDQFTYDIDVEYLLFPPHLMNHGYDHYTQSLYNDKNNNKIFQQNMTQKQLAPYSFDLYYVSVIHNPDKYKVGRNVHLSIQLHFGHQLILIFQIVLKV